MESCAESVKITKKYNTVNPSVLPIVNITSEQFLDKLLFFIKMIVEYAFVIQMGFGIGWLIGYFVGSSYLKHFEPVYIDDIHKLSHWTLIPYEFARNGAIIGVVVGVIVMMIINRKLSSRKELGS